MMVKPGPTSKKDALLCPLCDGVWEFCLNESLSDKGLHYICTNCNKLFHITRKEEHEKRN